jgi:hypothetical protein
MKALAMAELTFLTVVSCSAYSQTVPVGRAQLIISVDLGELPQGPLFWHLYNYPSRTAADGECQGSCRLNSVMILPITDAVVVAA